MYIKHLIGGKTWLIVLIAIVLSFIFPEPGLFLKPYLSYLLMALMFLSCLDISLHAIFKELKDFKRKLLMLGVIHLISPIIILLLKPWLSEEIFLGLILASVMCSGMSIVFLAELYRGAAADALVLTTISNVLSPLIVPFLVWVFAKTLIKIDPLTISWTMVKLVVLPIILASIVRELNWRRKFHHHEADLSIIILFVIILGVISPLRETLMVHWGEAIRVSILVIVLNAIGGLLGYRLGRTRAEKITFTLAGSYKNYVLSLILALSLFNSLVALPALVYTLINNASLIPLQWIFSRK